MKYLSTYLLGLFTPIILIYTDTPFPVWAGLLLFLVFIFSLLYNVIRFLDKKAGE